MSDSFDKIISEYKDYVELTEYSRSQYRVINDLSKRIQKLEEENKTLKKITEQSAPLDLNAPSESHFGSSDPEIIARTQLALLKRTSMSGEELTMEEAKRTQIFSDILIKATEGRKDSSNVQALDTKSLLALVEGINE